MKETAKIEQILDKEGAKACLAEIELRKHVMDTHEFRKALIKEIVYRHVEDKGLTLNEVMDLQEENEKCYCRRLINNLTNMIIDDMQSTPKEI